MKLHVRFLKQGLVEAETPPSFEQMSPEQKLDWAQTMLEKQSDEQLIKAMADFKQPEVNGYFDDAPPACAIQTEDGEEIAMRQEWQAFWGPREIVEPPILL